MLLACLRSLFCIAFVASVLMLAGAFYLEFAMGLVPCALCQSQRMLVAAFAGVCLLARLRSLGPARARAYAGLALGLAVAGSLLAVRHIWLQSHAMLDNLPCSRPLMELLQQGAFAEATRAMLLGSADCAVITWSFLELSLPEWSLLGFIVLAALALARLLQAGAPIQVKSLKP